jgi:hypothetical protein
MHHDHHCLPFLNGPVVTSPKSIELGARAPANLIRALHWTTLVIPGPSDVEAAISVGIGCYYNNHECLAKR